MAAIEQYFKNTAIAVGYNFFEKHWTGPVAIELVRQSKILSLPSNAPLKIIDHACGMGIVGALLYDQPGFKSRSAKVEYLNADFSESMLAAAQKRIQEGDWKGATTQLVDAQDSKLPDDHFTHVLCSLGYALMPDPLKALKDSVRILQPSGTFAFTAWTKAGWTPFMETALERLGAPAFRMPVPSEWMDAQYIRSEVDKVSDLEPSSIELVHHNVDTPLSNVQAFTDHAGGMVGMITQSWSQEDKDKYSNLVMSEYGKVLEEHFGVDTPFILEMEAIIVTATKKSN